MLISLFPFGPFYVRLLLFPLPFRVIFIFQFAIPPTLSVVTLMLISPCPLGPFCVRLGDIGIA